MLIILNRKRSPELDQLLLKQYILTFKKLENGNVVDIFFSLVSFISILYFTVMNLNDLEWLTNPSNNTFFSLNLHFMHFPAFVGVCTSDYIIIDFIMLSPVIFFCEIYM